MKTFAHSACNCKEISDTLITFLKPLFAYVARKFTKNEALQD